MGQRSPKAMKWAKEAQNSMSTSLMIVLGYWNFESIQQAQKRQSLQQTRFRVTATKPLPWTTTFWLPLEGHEFAERKRMICLRRVKVETIGPRRKEEKHSHVSCETTYERKLQKFSHMNCKSNPYAQRAKCWCPFLWICIQKPIRRKAQWKARLKGLPRRPKSKRGPKKEVQRKGICSRIQICRRIQFFGKMASIDKDKLGPRPFWSSLHYLAHKGPNPLI